MTKNKPKFCLNLGFLLFLIVSSSTFAKDIQCTVTSDAKITGKYWVCQDQNGKSNCGENKVVAELKRNFTLSIDDKKNENELKIGFENTVADWKIISGTPLNNDRVREVIYFGTANPQSEAYEYINAGLARISQDTEFHSNRENGIPVIQISNFGFETSHGSKFQSDTHPSEFEFKEPTTQGIFRFQHLISVACP